MDRSKLIIGTYFYGKNLYTDEHMRNLADMGVDFIVGIPSDKEVLDLCEKYGVKVLLSSTVPAWWGDNGQNAGGYAEKFPLEELDEIKKTYPSHPAIWGDYPVDEPNAKDFVHINAVIKRYEELFPGQIAFINLYPNYASVLPSADSDAVSQLGNVTYLEHIEQYAREIEGDYICFDSYPYGSVFAGYLQNLDDVSSVCRKTGRDMWVIVQTGAWKPEALLDEFQLRWQVNLCLAYGAKSIMHACYSHGWWDPATSCVDDDGNRNPTYYYAKNVNADLRALSDTFMKYTHLGVKVYGNAAEAEARISPQLTAQTARGEFAGWNDIKIQADGAVVAGFFECEGKRAVMLVATADPFCAHTPSKAYICAEGMSIRAHDGGNIIGFSDSCCLNIKSGYGIFIELE